MNEFVLYNLKAATCLAGFYLFYKLLLSRETFHRFNRFVLLFITVLSFVLPVCVVTIERVLPPAVETVMEALPVTMPQPAVTTMTPAADEVEYATEPTPFAWDAAAFALLLAGAAGALAWSAGSLVGVVRLIRRGRREPLEGKIVLVLIRECVTPFSWLRYIVLCDRDYRESGPQIIAHERAHIRLRHSLDLLLTDLCSCLQWFNPAMWLLRQELRAIHEYEADEAVLRSGADAKSYQMLLIKKAVGGRWYSVANSLNHSNLKSRITMMLRKRSSRWAAAKALLLLPLVCVALGAFARTAYVVADDKVTQNSENPQGFTGWMGIAPDGEGRMRLELEGEGDAIRGALGLVNYYSILYLATDPKESDFVRVLAALTENPGDVGSAERPLVLIDGRAQEQSMVLPAANRIASITLYDPAAARAAFAGKGTLGALVLETKQADAPNPAVQQALLPDEEVSGQFVDKTCWFSGRNLVGTPDGGLSMAGSFARLPLTKEEQRSPYESAMKKNFVELPAEWTFNGKCAVQMDGVDRAVATVDGYGDAMMAAASVINPMSGTTDGTELPLERRKLGKIVFRLSRTAASSPEWLAVPMPYTLVDGRRITRMEEVPDAGRILRIEVLGRSHAISTYGPEAEVGAVVITTKAEGVSTDDQVEDQRRKGARVTSAVSEEGPKPGERGFYVGGGMPTVEQDDAYVELLKTHLPKMRESMDRNGIEDLTANMQALYDSILRTRSAGEPPVKTLLKNQFSGKISCRVPDSERAICYLAGAGDAMMTVAGLLWNDHMPLGRIAYRLSFEGQRSPAWEDFPMPYTLVDGQRITSGGQVPDAGRIRRIEVLGGQQGAQRFGDDAASGAVLIDTKPADVATDALVEAEMNRGVGFMTVGVTTFSIASPESVTEGTDRPDWFTVREPARKVRRVESASFSGKAAFASEHGNEAIMTCYLAGKGDAMMAIASQLWRDTPELSIIAYRLSKTGGSDRAWKAEPMPYTLVDGRRIDQAAQMPDARYIDRVLIMEPECAKLYVGPEARDGAVLILTKKAGHDNSEAVEMARERGARMMSAGRMSYEAESPVDVRRSAVGEQMRSTTTVQLSADGQQSGPVQTTVVTEADGTNGRRMENRIVLLSGEGKPVMALMALNDSVSVIQADTVRYLLETQQLDQANVVRPDGEGRRMTTTVRVAADEAQAVKHAASDYGVVFKHVSTEYDPETGYTKLIGAGRDFSVRVGSGYNEVLVYVDGERQDVSFLEALDPGQFGYVRLLQTEEQLAAFGEKAGPGKIGIALYTKKGWHSRKE